jgi:hypothetical protein
VLGCLEAELGNLDRGLELCRKAHGKLEQALAATPRDRALRSDWLTNREALARYGFRKGELPRDRWIAEQQAILRERKDLVRQEPPSPRLAGEVAATAAVLAGLLLEADRYKEALELVEEVLPVHEQVVRLELERVQAAAKKQQQPNQLPATAKPDRSLERFMRNTVVFPDGSLQRQWAALLERRGAALARLGRGAEAARAVRQALDVTERRLAEGRPFQRRPWSLVLLRSVLPEVLWLQEPGPLQDLAGHLALAATLPEPVPGQADPAARAVWALRLAVVAGFDNLQQLQTDPALEPLRRRADFRNLVRDLEANAPGRP